MDLWISAVGGEKKKDLQVSDFLRIFAEIYCEELLSYIINKQ